MGLMGLMGQQLTAFLYEALYSTRNANCSGVEGFLKCAKPIFKRRTALILASGGFGNAGGMVCTPHLSPRPGKVGGGCVLYRSVDLTVNATKRANVSQWLLHGRTEHDWITTLPSSPPSSPSPPRTKPGTVTVQVIVNTPFPFDNAVSLTLRWADEKVAVVALHPRIRIPSWLSPPRHGPSAHQWPACRQCKPGTYMLLDKVNWTNGDVITFALPR